MKKLLMMMVLVMGAARIAHAGQVGDFFDGFVTDTHVKFLQNISPMYFYDLGNGRSQGGVVTSFLDYHNGILTADAGWVNQFEASTKGQALLGGNFHIDKFVAQTFPSVAEVIRAMIPTPAQPFLSKINIGLATAHDFSNDQFVYGLYSGIEYAF